MKIEKKVRAVSLAIAFWLFLLESVMKPLEEKVYA